MKERKGGWRDKVARRYGRRATPVDRIVRGVGEHNEDKASWMQRACSLSLSLSPISLSRSPTILFKSRPCPFLGISIISVAEPVVQTDLSPFPPCTVSPRQVPSFSFFSPFSTELLKLSRAKELKEERWLSITMRFLQGGCTKHCRILQRIRNDYRRVNSRARSCPCFKNHHTHTHTQFQSSER